MMHYFIDSTLFSIMYPILLTTTLIWGYLIAKKGYKNKGKIWTPSGTEGPIIGLFALLLSFTFLSTNNVMRERISIIHKEADAIANLRRQSLLCSADYKNSTNEFLKTYIDLQISFYFTSDYKKSETIITQIEHLNGQYLTSLIRIGNINPDSKLQLQGLFPYYNNLSSSFYAITYSFKERAPLLIIILLISASLLISLLVGFMNGFYEGGKHLLVPLIFIVLVTLSIHTIRDMDNPLKGTIKPNIDNLMDLKMSLLGSKR
ncbi:uncharacterized protein YneF (UPF0154 family) [Pedobacter sp. UYP24]